MIYTVVTLAIGIYIGQEYPLLPSIKLLGLSFLEYLNTFKKQPESGSITWFEYWFKKEN
jgi:uncharacterized protein YqgC (DUF456 family)